MIESSSVRIQVQRHLFPAGLRLSASALETYARCPFRYFLTAVLGLPQWEEPEQVLTLQPRDRGALLHGILQDFFTHARKTGWLPLAGKDKGCAQGATATGCQKHFHQFAQLGATGFSLLWDIEQERMLEQLLRFWTESTKPGRRFCPLPLKSGLEPADRPGRMESFSPIFPMVPCASNLTMEKRLLCEAALIALTFRLTSNAPVS
jgi:hypothetical protein